MKKQKSMMDHMRSRNAMVGGEDPIRSKKLEPIELPVPAKPTSLEQYGYDLAKDQFRQKHEMSLMQKEIDRYKNRENMLGGGKNVSKKIKRREKFKKGLDDAIIFLGTN
jgi:hypothetical protein